MESHELTVTRKKVARGIPGAVERLQVLLKSRKHVNGLIDEPEHVILEQPVTVTRQRSRWEARWIDNS